MKNYEEYERAKKLIDEANYKEAEKILKKLHQQEPTSSLLKYELGHLWIISGKDPERGEKYLSKLLDYSNQATQTKAQLDLGKYELSKNNKEKAREYYEQILKSNRNKEKAYALMELVFIEIREENYQKAYELLQEVEKISNDVTSENEFYQTKKYIEYKLGILNNIEELKKSYFYSQMINYDEDKAIDHIKLHLDDKVKDKVHSVFLDSVNVEELYHEARIKIGYLNPNILHFADRYVLKYDSPIGIFGDSYTNNAQIVAFPNTNDIITMYPTYNEKSNKI